MEFKDVKYSDSHLAAHDMGGLTNRFEVKTTTDEEYEAIHTAVQHLLNHVMSSEDKVSIVDSGLLMQYFRVQNQAGAPLTFTPDEALRFARLVQRSGRELMGDEDGVQAIALAKEIEGEATARKFTQQLELGSEAIAHYFSN